MKRILIQLLLACCLLSLVSCSHSDEKEISGTLLFTEVGSHSFNINAKKIEATITLVGPNFGETLIFENVSLEATSDYFAHIGISETGSVRSELLNNLVVMYHVDSGHDQIRSSRIEDPGYIRIDWRGYN